MKKTILISLFLGLFCQIIVLSQDQTTDLNSINKQVTALKYRNSNLERNLKNFKASEKNFNDSLQLKLKDIDLKLNTAMDTLKAKEQIIIETKNCTTLLHKSLKHRKNLFIIGSILGLVILVIILFLMNKKYKADTKKLETLLADSKKVLEDEMNRLKADLQTQINSAKDELEQKIKDQEKKINDLKK